MAKKILGIDRLDGTPYQVIKGYANVYKIPDLYAPPTELVTQVLYGEIFTVSETKNGLAYGQLQTDGCVGYLDARFLSPDTKTPTHIVCVPRTSLYAGPDHKPAAIEHVSFMSPLNIIKEQNGMAELQRGGWVRADHIAPVGTTEPDFVKTAEMFLGVPYYLQGRTGYALDCSALVQLSLARAGVSVGRHTYAPYTQSETFGTEIQPGDLQRGDIVYFPGHVGIMTDGETLLHAEYLETKVAAEPLDSAIAKKGDIICVKRV